MRKRMTAFALVLLFGLLTVVSGFAADSSGEKVVVTWFGVDKEPVTTIEAFNNSQDEIEVVYELVGTDNYFTTLNVRIMAGEGPDLFAYRTKDNYENLIAMGQLLDLTDYAFMDNFIEGAIEANRANDGRVYAFPLNANYLNLFYNKDLFKELGLSEPTNYQEFLHCCEVLLENGVAPTVSGCKDLWQNRYVGIDPLQAMNGKDPTWPTKLLNYEVKFTDPDCLEYFNRIEAFVKAGYLYDGSLGLTMPQAWVVFANGEAGMQLGASFYAAQAFPEATPDFEVGVCPMPFNDEGQEQVVFLHANMTVVAVNQKSDHVDATLKFLEWLSNVDNYTLLAQDLVSIVPVHKDIDYSKLDPAAKLWSHFSEYKSVPRALEPSTISSEFGQVVQNIILGIYTGQEAAESLQAAYEAKK